MSKAELRKLVSEELKISENTLTDKTSFLSDLGVDSLAILKLICRIENKYDIDIDQDQIDLLDNLDTAYRYIKSLRDEKNV